MRHKWHGESLIKSMGRRWLTSMMVSTGMGCVRWICVACEDGDEAYKYGMEMESTQEDGMKVDK